MDVAHLDTRAVAHHLPELHRRAARLVRAHHHRRQRAGGKAEPDVQQQPARRQRVLARADGRRPARPSATPRGPSRGRNGARRSRCNRGLSRNRWVPVMYSPSRLAQRPNVRRAQQVGGDAVGGGVALHEAHHARLARARGGFGDACGTGGVGGGRLFDEHRQAAREGGDARTPACCAGPTAIPIASSPSRRDQRVRVGEAALRRRSGRRPVRAAPYRRRIALRAAPEAGRVAAAASRWHGCRSRSSRSRIMRAATRAAGRAADRRCARRSASSSWVGGRHCASGTREPMVGAAERFERDRARRSRRRRARARSRPVEMAGAEEAAMVLVGLEVEQVRRRRGGSPAADRPPPCSCGTCRA